MLPLISVSLQQIHTPDLFIYINIDLILNSFSYGSVPLCTIAVGLSEHDILKWEKCVDEI